MKKLRFFDHSLRDADDDVDDDDDDDDDDDEDDEDDDDDDDDDDDEDEEDDNDDDNILGCPPGVAGIDRAVHGNEGTCTTSLFVSLTSVSTGSC